MTFLAALTPANLGFESRWRLPITDSARCVAGQHLYLGVHHHVVVIILKGTGAAILESQHVRVFFIKRDSPGRVIHLGHAKGSDRSQGDDDENRGENHILAADNRQQVVVQQGFVGGSGSVGAVQRIGGRQSFWPILPRLKTQVRIQCNACSHDGFRHFFVPENQALTEIGYSVVVAEMLRDSIIVLGGSAIVLSNASRQSRSQDGNGGDAVYSSLFRTPLPEWPSLKASGFSRLSTSGKRISMCGIVGAISFKNSSFQVSDPYLTRMRETMVHRGPDGGANWIAPDRKVGLGHRRLSIIDLSTTADQPMCNEDGTLWVVFNGEIYNHAEIRTELLALGGHNWRTDHSDTEVILHAFEQWGIDCIHRFRGMFAIALWDTRRRELWLIRDRIGVKPLYYSIHHGRLTFASEIKALLQDPDQSRSVDEASFFHYLSFLATPAPQTLFAGIQKLTNGTWIRVDENGSITTRRYWDPLENAKPLTGISEDEIAEMLLAELRTSVKLRKVSDVPVGVFLSGGIDSSTNAALFSEDDSSQVKTFSVGYDDNYEGCTSELPYAREFASQVHADHHERILTQQDFLDFLPRMIQLQDEPIADPVCMPVYYVSKLARDNGVIVAQVGEGSDELFWGYSYWERMLKLERWNRAPVPRSLRRLGLAALGLSGRGSAKNMRWCVAQRWASHCSGEVPTPFRMN